MFNNRQLREVFHFLFLGRLIKISDPSLYVLKGGVNLRFFFKSPRYSEDMDLDAVGGAIKTLEKNVYKILQDDAFRRSLEVFGIDDIHINDPSKAKQTSTTQRFRAHLITGAGERLPTKVEFSRRPRADEATIETIDPQVARMYRQLSVACRHYPGDAAARQKLAALANRTEPQARDVFDLYILWLGGHFDEQTWKGVSDAERESALVNLAGLSYDDYSGQVVDFLEDEALERFGSETSWTDMVERTYRLIEV